MAIILLVLETYFGLISGSKADILFVILPILVIHWNSRTKPVNYLKLVWVLLIFIVIAVPLVEGFRLFVYISSNGFDRLSLSNLSIIFQFISELKLSTILELALSRFHAFDSLVLLYDKIDEIGFSLGSTLYLFFAAFFPRAFWPEKPNITLGSWFNTEIWNPHLDYTVNAGISIFLPNDLYLNFGFFGFILFLFLMGFFIARMSVYLHVFSYRSPYIAVFYIFLLTRFSILWEGGFAAYLSGWAKVTIFYVVIFQVLSTIQRLRLRASRKSVKNIKYSV